MVVDLSQLYRVTLTPNLLRGEIKSIRQQESGHQRQCGVVFSNRWMCGRYYFGLALQDLNLTWHPLYPRGRFSYLRYGIMNKLVSALRIIQCHITNIKPYSGLSCRCGYLFYPSCKQAHFSLRLQWMLNNVSEDLTYIL